MGRLQLLCQTQNVLSRGRYDADVIVDTLNAYRKFAVDNFQNNTISLGNIACSFIAMVIKSVDQPRQILDNKSFLTIDLFLFYCNSIGWMFGCHQAKMA